MGKYEINLVNYFNQYKLILKSCYSKGKILPVLLNEIYVPREYNYSDREYKKLVDGISETNKNKIKQEYVNRRKLEKEYVSEYAFTKVESRNEAVKMWDKFKDKEFKLFLEDFPKFKNIVK